MPSDPKSGKYVESFPHELLGAEQAVQILNRRWFEHTLDPTPDRLMALLLLTIYWRFITDDPIHKKSVGNLIAVEDVKTARKYIRRAVEAGYIEINRSTEDRRKELLFPSAKLMEAAGRELQMFLTSIIIAAEDIYSARRSWGLDLVETDDVKVPASNSSSNAGPDDSARSNQPHVLKRGRKK